MKKSLLISICTLLVLLISCEEECDPTIENCDDVFTATSNCPNNSSFDCSNNILLGQVVKDKLNAEREADYFAFELTEIGVLEVNVDAVPNGMRMYVSVYNTNNENSLLKSANANSGQSIFFDVGPMDLGVHYIAVSSNNTSDEDYSLTINLDTNDKNEFNNTFAEARPIDFETTLQGTLRSNGDVDYFKFSNDVAGVLEVNIPEVPDGNGIRMFVHVYNTNNENSLLKSAYADSGQSISLDVGPMEIGVHYIVISTSSNRSSADIYELNINLNSTDANEVNNSFAQASTINVGETKTGTIHSDGDVDYYKVTTTQAGVLSVSIPEVPDGLRMFARIYETNNDNSFIGYSYADSGESINVQANSTTSAGTHYVGISANGASRDTYEITINNN